MILYQSSILFTIIINPLNATFSNELHSEGENLFCHITHTISFPETIHKLIPYIDQGTHLCTFLE